MQSEVEQYLEKQAAANTVLPENENEVQWLVNAPINSVEEVIRQISVQSAYRALYLLNQFQSVDAKRAGLLEERVIEYRIAIGAVEEPTGKPGINGDDSLLPSEETIDVYKSEYLEVEEQDKGDRAKADLFGDNWETSAQHLVEEYLDFIDDVNQEVPLL